MKDILFGMAVGGIIGILLYKNNDCARDLFDESEKMIKREIEKADQASKKPQQKKQA